MMEDTKSEQKATIVCDEYSPLSESSPTLPPLVISHAVLDCKKNWKNIAATLAENTKRKVYVLDLPDHNENDPAQNLEFDAIYNGFAEFVEKIGKPVVLIGHSLGAVASIILATNQPEMVNRLVIIDISPIDYPERTEESLSQCTKIMREALAAVPKGLPFQKAESVIMKFLEKAIPAEVIRRMLIGNLKEGINGIQWNCDLDSMEITSVNNSTYKRYPLKCLCYTETLLVYGEVSEFVSENDFHDMKTILPKLRLYCMKGASHWIHMEQPEKLIQVIADFLSEDK